MEHINSVENGMYQDTDARMQPAGTYYSSIDGELISQGNNNYKWKSINGTVFSFLMKDILQIPIGFCSLRNKLIIFSTDGTVSQISYMTFVDSGSASYTTTKPLYASLTLGFAKDYMIEAVSSPETGEYQRIYWVEENNQPRSLNISKIVQVVTGDISAGVTYLVTSLSITYDSISYTYGNTFVGVAGVTAFTGTGTVIENIDSSTLNLYPTYISFKHHFDNFCTGSLYSGLYFIAIQLESLNGSITSWDLNQEGIPLFKEINYGNADAYQAIPGHNGVVPVATGRGISIKVSNIDLNFNKIRVAVFLSQDDLVLQPGVVIGEFNITTSTQYISITDYIGTAITVEELFLKPITIEKAGTISIIRNHLVLGRLTEESIIDFNNPLISTPTVSIYELPCDNRYTDGTDTSTTAMVGHTSFNTTTGVPSGNIYPKQWYKVVGGTISYEGSTITDGSFFKGVESVTGKTYSSPTGTPIVNPVIRIMKYTDRSGVIHYDNYDLNAAFLDYKNPLVCQLLKGFYGGEKYRIGILPISLSGKEMRVKWITDIDIPYRNNKNNPGTNYPLMSHYYDGSSSLGPYSENWNINVLSLLFDIDISEFVSSTGVALIKGFSIVAAKLDSKIISDVFYTHTIRQQDLTSSDRSNQIEIPYSLVHNYDRSYGTIPPPDIPKEEEPYCKMVYSPEVAFGLITTISGEETYLKYLDHFEPEFPYGCPEVQDWDWINEVVTYFKNGYMMHPIGLGIRHAMFQKFNRNSEVSSLYSGKEVSSLMKYSFILNKGDATTYSLVNSGAYVNIVNKGNMYTNDYYYALDPLMASHKTDIYAQGMGERGIFVEIESSTLGPTYDDVTPGDPTSGMPILHYGTIERLLPLPYGGTSDSAKENTIYRHLGHYLELTPSVIADSYHAGTNTYILSDIQVFGQDVYIQPWDLTRLIADQYKNLDFEYRILSHGISAPIQSKVNISLRRHNHIAKNRFYLDVGGSPYYQQGMYYDTALSAISYRLDEFYYEHRYSYKFLDKIFLSLYEGISLTNKFDYRFRWSSVKIYGEDNDAYLLFNPFDFKDLDPANGQITNLKTKKDRLYYWQERTIGYISVNERALISGELGDLTELGTGGKFERTDNVIDFCGNTHQFALVEVNDGFVWFDIPRRSLIHMGTGFSLVKVSKLLGLDKFMNSIDSSYYSKLSSVNNNGIFGMYIEKENKVIFGFYRHTSQLGYIDNFGLTFNNEIKKIEGFLSIGPCIGININGYSYMYSTKSAYTIYLWNSLTYKLFNTFTTPTIEFNINPRNNGENVFDNCMVTGNENFFSSTIFTNEDGSTTENIYDTSGNKLTRYYEYRQKKWYFSIPLILNRKRFQSDVLNIKFAFNSTRMKIVEFLNIKTIFRKSK